MRRCTGCWARPGGNHDHRQGAYSDHRRSGEALVTYKLLKHEIDSARMATDAGVDLVMYIPGHRQSATIRVKRSGGGRFGAMGLPTRWVHGELGVHPPVAPPGGLPLPPGS